MGIVIAFLYFSFRFKRKEEKEIGSAKSHHNLKLEIVWQVIPFVIFMVAFAWGAILYYEVRRPPENSLEIHVFSQMWNWEFVYKNGRKTVNELYVPKDRPVKLIMTSRDVLHSFSIPAFKIKQDVVPGMYTSLWFEARRKGKFQVFCTEFCGAGHSQMLAKLHVMELKDWEKWLADNPYEGLSLSQIGEKTFQGRCTVCHKVNRGNSDWAGSCRNFWLKTGA